MRSSPIRLPYGAAIDSEQLNSWSELVIADLQEAIKYQAEAREKAELVTLLQSYEDLFLARQQEETAKEFRLLRRELQAMELQAGKVDIDVPIASAEVVEGHQMAAYGCLLPPVYTVVDRLPITATATVTVSPLANDQDIKDTALESIVDHRYDTVWLRTVEVPLDSAATQVDAQVEVTLPEQVPTTRLNVIGFLPYPSWGLDVIAVEVLSEQNVWIKVQDSVRSIGPLLTTFSPMHTSRIRIHLRQRHSILFGDKKMYVLGIRDLTALSASFGTAISVRVPIRFPQAGMWVTGITASPSTPNIRTHVRIAGSDILPVFVSEDQCEAEVVLEGDGLGPVRGLTAHLAQ